MHTANITAHAISTSNPVTEIMEDFVYLKVWLFIIDLTRSYVETKPMPECRLQLPCIAPETEEEF